MSKTPEKSDRSLRAVERERRELQREREQLLKDLQQLQRGEDVQPTQDTASPTPVVTATDSASFKQHSPEHIPAAVTGASMQMQQPIRPSMSPDSTANAKDRIGSHVDPVFDASSKEAHLTIDTTTLTHLAGAAAHTGTGINPMNVPLAGAPVYIGPGLDHGSVHARGASTPKGDGIPPMLGDRDAIKHDGSTKDGPDKVDKPGSVKGDVQSRAHEANPNAHLVAPVYSPARKTSFSDSGGDLEQDGSMRSVSDEEDKLSFAGSIPVKSSGEKDVKQTEQETMRMLNDLLIQTRALNSAGRENRETISEKEYRTVDIELEQKTTIERIRSLQHEEKLMSERRARKEKELLEAEERLRQIKEKGTRFEEALIERERCHKEEQKKLERLQFIKEEERKLVEALRQREGEELYFDERLERLQQEERNVLNYIENRQREFDERMSTMVKTEPNQDRKPQVGTIRDRGEARQQIQIEPERNITRNCRQETDIETYRNREREIRQQVNVETERNRIQDMRDNREYAPERNRVQDTRNNREYVTERNIIQGTREHKEYVPVRSRHSSSIESDAQSSRREELDKREAYLKQLEADLLRKEEEIRAKISNVPAEKTVEPAVKTQDATGSVKPEPSSSARPEFTYLNKPYVSQFSGVEPTPKNESTFESWRLEIESLRSSNIFPEYMVTQSIRNSLKVPARSTLLTLGPRASSEEILHKLESVFGNVASGQSIMQEFYTAVQQPDENVTMWSLRLEEILQRVAEKSSISAEQKNVMLKERFWRSLHSTELQNATQVYYHQTKDFEELRRKVRAEEYERFTHKKALKDVNTVQGKTALDKKETQHQPLTFNTDAQKREQELMKKLDILEKQIKANRNWQNRQRQRERRNQNQNRNQTPQEQQQQQQQRQQQQEQQAQINERLGQIENRQHTGQNTRQNTNAKKPEQSRQHLN